MTAVLDRLFIAWRHGKFVEAMSARPMAHELAGCDIVEYRRIVEPAHSAQASGAVPVGYVHLVPDSFSESYDVRFWEAVPIGTKLYTRPTLAKQDGGAEPDEPEFYCAHGWLNGEKIFFPGYSNETEKGVKDLILQGARAEGFKGTIAGRMMELEWGIAPVYSRPPPAEPPKGEAEVIYRWRALDHSGYCYGSNPPADLPARCTLTAFYSQPDYAIAALHEIAGTTNRTATPQQFIDYLQKLATTALVDRTAEPVSSQRVPDDVLDLVRFLAETWHAIDKWAHTLQRCEEIGNYPVIQGTSNQLRLIRIGEQSYDVAAVLRAVDWMLAAPPASEASQAARNRLVFHIKQRKNCAPISPSIDEMEQWLALIDGRQVSEAQP